MIEAAGISTICLATIPVFTASVGAPRIAAIQHPMGRTVGMAGDAETQREVVRATLQAVEKIEEPGGRVDLPFEWPEPDRQAKRHRAPAPPIARLIMKKPWLLLKFIAGEIPESE